MSLILWFFFVLLNGKLTAEIALFGALVTLLAEFLAVLLTDWSLKKEWLFLKNIPKIALYALRLLWEIFKANLAVLRRVLSPKAPKPAIVTIPRKSPSEWRTVLEANSITLTPGTLTLRLTDDRLIVHCLDESFSEGLEQNALTASIENLGGDRS